ncbi:hypothetical protein [Epibacterium sp. Ofav1-8]|uniref:hypothetical protein n=1 Tax=Epibacterium sp. Ofav1-8 TaxID=2917735 RepID=UPI001EF45529|nr:hypothetical protein [Epibacterium sp. Ofav1-8]MCG7625054.1 hypothetical protein [Epibacterium sp. Ofav1-8]
MGYRPEEASVIAGVKHSIAWIDRLAWFALVFTLSAAAARIFGQDGVSLVGIRLPFAGSVLGLGAITLVHFFVSRHIIRSCADAWSHLSNKQRNALFDDIVRTGGILTKGANTYRGAITESRYSLELKTEISDPPTWVHFALVLSTLLAIVNIEWSFLALSQFCFAIAFILTNWNIGAGWALCLGDLGSDRNSSAYFLDGTARPRGISYMSGLIISNNISFKNYLGGSVVEAAIASILLWILLLIPFLTISGLVLLGKAITDF